PEAKQPRGPARIPSRRGGRDAPGAVRRYRRGGRMISAAAVLLLAQVAIASPAAPPAASPTPRPTPSGPVVVLETSLGRIKIGLYDDKSPVSTENFLKYVRKGHYDGTLFHRVMPNFMIQGGGMIQDMSEKPTEPPIRNEARNGLRNSRGTVAMA